MEKSLKRTRKVANVPMNIKIGTAPIACLAALGGFSSDVACRVAIKIMPRRHKIMPYRIDAFYRDFCLVCRIPKVRKGAPYG